MELIMLGTGNAMVTRCYNTCFVLSSGEEYFLVDAGGGNGIFKQLEQAGVPFTGIREMFVTHAHTDHILGAIWVIRKIATLMSNDKYRGNFIVYGHNEVIDALRTFCRLTLPGKILKYIDERIFWGEVKDGTRKEILGLPICFFDILSTKMKQFGFRVLLPDGQVLVCLGDEPYNEACKKYVEQADWLLAEAFCLYRDREIFSPYEKHHSTALDAGRLAEALGVKHLVLYHTEDKTLAERKEAYTREASSVFTGRVYVPDDLERISLEQLEKFYRFECKPIIHDLFRNRAIGFTGLERRGFGCFFSNESGSQGDGIFSETTDRHRKPGFL